MGEMGGQQSLSTRGSSNKLGVQSAGRRTRPISAYPIQGHQLLMVGESVEYKIDGRVISPNKQKKMFKMSPIFKMELFKVGLRYQKATFSLRKSRK